MKLLAILGLTVIGILLFVPFSLALMYGKITHLEMLTLCGIVLFAGSFLLDFKK